MKQSLTCQIPEWISFKKYYKLLIAILIVSISTIGIILFLDLDGDGLIGITEISNGANIFSTNSDGDDLSDGDEVNKFHTNPSNPDTDGDGLDDNSEITTYNTNPNDKDSNDDGFNDGYEFGITGDSDGLNDFSDETYSNSTTLDENNEDLDDFNDEGS